jgi:hypothetical protein
LTAELAGWRERRSRILADCGAAPPLHAELLDYNERPFDRRGGAGLHALPLGDELHIAAWSDYAEHARNAGAWAALRERFLQLCFPIREGISQDAVYRRATLQGIWPAAAEAGSELPLNDPAGLELTLRQTLAGRIPILTVRDRADFASLVRAFTCRNEPTAVSSAMGACVVTGLPNWDRVTRYRALWTASQPSAGGGDWAEEFKHLASRKELYQDRFIILSNGSYSGIPAEAAGLDESEWPRQSLVIRREHECTHYLMHRVLGSMKNNLQDEVIADFVGLVHAFGDYRADLALRFFGLECYPAYRAGGRLEMYLGSPPLSEGATAIVRTLVFRTARNLETWHREHGSTLKDDETIARTALRLADLSLEELASDETMALLGPSPDAPGR